MLRSSLLAPCLLTCLACKTTFPFEKLEQGMTPAEVRAVAGEPEANFLNAGRDARGGSAFPAAALTEEKMWGYTHEQWSLFALFRPARDPTPHDARRSAQVPFLEVLGFVPYLVVLPLAILTSPVLPDRLRSVFVIERGVGLYFEDEKLVRWAVGGGGCVSFKSPQLRSCTNQCTTNHNACVSEATQADQLESCNTEIRSCAPGCEKVHGVIKGACVRAFTL